MESRNSRDAEHVENSNSESSNSDEEHANPTTKEENPTTKEENQEVEESETDDSKANLFFRRRGHGLWPKLKI